MVFNSLALVSSLHSVVVAAQPAVVREEVQLAGCEHQLEDSNGTS